MFWESCQANVIYPPDNPSESPSQLNSNRKVKWRRLGQCNLGGGLTKQESELFYAVEEGRLNAPVSSVGREESPDFDDFEKDNARNK